MNKVSPTKRLKKRQRVRRGPGSAPGGRDAPCFIWFEGRAPPPREVQRTHSLRSVRTGLRPGGTGRVAGNGYGLRRSLARPPCR
jgi:hypothetical protein